MIEKDKYSLLWQTLAEELNSIGPPRNSVEKWKRVWSVFKYNNRKRLPSILGYGSASQQGNILWKFLGFKKMLSLRLQSV